MIIMILLLQSWLKDKAHGTFTYLLEKSIQLH